MKLKTTPTTLSSKKSYTQKLLSPKASTICNILTFAAAYSVESLNNTPLKDIMMN